MESSNFTEGDDKIRDVTIKVKNIDRNIDRE